MFERQLLRKEAMRSLQAGVQLSQRRPATRQLALRGDTDRRPRSMSVNRLGTGGSDGFVMGQGSPGKPSRFHRLKIVVAG